jgi:hypothetical protein
MDGADLELFERSLRHATEAHSGEALDAALAEVGWHDALAADQRAAVSLLFELQGAANATSSALDHLVGTVLGLDAVSNGGVVLPALGGWSPPGELDHEQEAVVAVRGLATAAIAGREQAVIVVGSSDEKQAVVVNAAELTQRAVHGVDPWLGLVEITGTAAVATTIEPVDWTAALMLGRLAVGHELVGATRAMLELAREHALERIQFGQPISKFQAVRHRLAETLIAVEAADSALGAAWDDWSSQSVAMAKALAGRSARIASRHCQQVLAGIGFTTEHSFHRYARRVLVLDGLLGDARALTRELGAELLHSRRLPPLVSL